METEIGGESNQLFSAGASSSLGKKSLEWDLNDWGWNGNLFRATPVNGDPSGCRNMQLFPPATGVGSGGSPSGSEENGFGIVGYGIAESEKRRRVVAVNDGEPCDQAGSLTLKLGGHAYPIGEADLASCEGKNGKRSKPSAGNCSRSSCQVEGCVADLSEAKDYHRRHRVCETHAKANMAMVANQIQRFCQQCSRFHLIQEFDEGRRSCRRRLAGHNRRRRKTNADATASGSSLSVDQASSYLLISLLRILSNLQANSSEQSKDQDLLTHLLSNLANLAGSPDKRNLSRLLQESQNLHKFGTSAEIASQTTNTLVENGVAVQEFCRPLSSPFKVPCASGGEASSLRQPNLPASVVTAPVETPLRINGIQTSLGETVQADSSHATTMPAVDVLPAKGPEFCSLQHILPAESTLERDRLRGFDLNNTYTDNQDCRKGSEGLTTPAAKATRLPNCPSWMLQNSQHSSPLQVSDNSDSSSAPSLCSNGDAQCRTDKIVFKLFGKGPADIPVILRTQILEWLSQSPTDMESYIRPGCIILTIYLRLADSAWKELCHDLCSWLNRLLFSFRDDFWRIGWVYARVQHRIAFAYNGHVMVDTPLVLRSPDPCKIICITPIAAAVSAKINFTVKGFNIAQSTMRLLCAFDGKYLVQQATQAIIEGNITGNEHEGLECLSFSCSLPNASGRGFIEVEDHGLSSTFFPFIVAEEDVCFEIRMLESSINVTSHADSLEEKMDTANARNEAVRFLHEIGWLLRRNHLSSTSEQIYSCPNVFPMAQFKWLLSFAMNQEWCAVLRKLLDILFQENIDLGGYSPVEFVTSEALLHSAVQKKSKPMIEFLLRYSPKTATKETGPDIFSFRPDMLGPSNITPLHIAATIDGAERLLDALTNDPGQLGIKSWRTVRDSTGFTPEDYARSRGHDSYIQLVQKKIDERSAKGAVVVNIPGSLLVSGAKQADVSSTKSSGLQIDMSKYGTAPKPYCKRCDQQLAYRSTASRSLLYRPAMLSLVCIAAICVCVSLVITGPPKVLFIRPPFNWNDLACGPM